MSGFYHPPCRGRGKISGYDYLASRAEREIERLHELRIGGRAGRLPASENDLISKSACFSNSGFPVILPSRNRFIAATELLEGSAPRKSPSPWDHLLTVRPRVKKPAIGGRENPGHIFLKSHASEDSVTSKMVS